jgi:CHRD domain
MRTTGRIALAGFGAALLLPLGTGAALAADGDANANLAPVALNGVEGSGTAMARVQGTTLTVTMAANGLLADAPHAAHIHFGAEARNECPAAADDTSGDGTLNTSEGGPAYGGIVVSLTKTGDTSPASGLAVDRYDTAPGGTIAYQRGSIEVAPEVAQAIVDGKSVVVIHGVDHDGNGTYSGATPSDLDPSLPTEATDPALCGVLHAAPAGGVDTGAGGTAGVSTGSGASTGLLALGGGLLAAGAGAGVLAARRVRATV